MKQVDDYTDEELLELTSEQVNTLIELECAYAGAGILPPLPTPPEKLDMQRDATVYEVAGISFVYEADAAEVANLINFKKRAEIKYNYNAPSEARYIYEGLNHNDEAHIATKHLMTREFYDSIASRATDYATAQGAYEAAKKEYDKIDRARGDIRTAINERIMTARQLKQKRDNLMDIFGQYLVLAENDFILATTFFTKAYPTAFDTYEGLETEIQDRYAP